MRQPLAIIINDVHYNQYNIALCNKVMRQAAMEAHGYHVPLIVAGDLNDTKAIIRGEVLNALIETMEYCNSITHVYVMIGNHDLINHHAYDHTLNFLRGVVDVVVQAPVMLHGLYLIPYRVSDREFLTATAGMDKHSTIVAHQGLRNSHSGDYFSDPTAVDATQLPPNIRVISGHYHRRQDIDLPNGGTWTYLGSPFTHTFGEAEDGVKGFNVLYTDGSVELVPTNLRKHVIVTRDVDSVMQPIEGLNKEDLLWMKVTGPYSEVRGLKKKDIGLMHLGHSNFKLDLIPTDLVNPTAKKLDKLTHSEILDSVIKDSTESKEQKKYLSKLWREILNEAS